MNRYISGFLLCVVAVIAASAGSARAEDSATTQPIVIDLALSPTILDMPHLKANRMGFMPAGVKLVTEKPAAIVKEPAYMGTPKYGSFHIGNGPKSVTWFAVDEAAGKTGKLYVDTNQNGDLTDDGPGNWDIAKDMSGVLNYRSNLTVHASRGTADKEEDAGSYTLFVYKRDGDSQLAYCKLTGRAGKLPIGDKTYSVVLAENNNNGLFVVPEKVDKTHRPLELYIDLDGDGTFKGAEATIDGKKMILPERFSLTNPFQIDGQWYRGEPSISGAKLTITAATAPADTQVAAALAPKEKHEMLATGAPAPDFTATAPDGSPVHLSDFKGKLVLMDFWATWCGPCQASMPGLEKIYQGVKDQDVVVLSVNVFDEKPLFDKWILKHSGTDYHFTFAFDPAAKDNSTNIAVTKFGVSVIPTMYIIGKDGKVVDHLTGSGQEAALTKILNDQGIKTKAE